MDATTSLAATSLAFHNVAKPSLEAQTGETNIVLKATIMKAVGVPIGLNGFIEMKLCLIPCAFKPSLVI